MKKKNFEREFGIPPFISFLFPRFQTHLYFQDSNQTGRPAGRIRFLRHWLTLSLSLTITTLSKSGNQTLLSAYRHASSRRKVVSKSHSADVALDFAALISFSNPNTSVHRKTVVFAGNRDCCFGVKNSIGKNRGQRKQVRERKWCQQWCHRFILSRWCHRFHLHHHLLLLVLRRRRVF